MMTLDEYHKERQAHWGGVDRPKNNEPSGVRCNGCGKELRIDLSALLLSDPPQRNIWCGNCGWRGCVLA